MNKPQSSFRPSKRPVPSPCQSLQIMACTICLVHSRILSNISDLDPLGASGTTPPAVTTKDVPRHCQMSSVCAGGWGGTITLLIMAVWLRTPAIKGTRRLGQHSCPQMSHQTCSRMASPTLAPPEPHGVSDPSLYVSPAPFQFLVLTTT